MAAAIAVDSARHRQPVGAGGDDVAVVQRAIGIEIGNGLGLTAVGIENRSVGLGAVERTASGAIALGGDGQSVGAGGDHRAIEQRAVGAAIDYRLGAAAIRIDRDDIGVGAIEGAGTGSV